jgi:hypothetical protein
LLPASLDDLLHALESLIFVGLMRRLQLIDVGCEESLLPQVAGPTLICVHVLHVSIVYRVTSLAS